MFSGFKEISENVDDGHSKKKITKEMVANVESDVIDDAGVVITVETQIFEQTEELQVPDEKIYSVLLKTTNCIVPVDEGYQAFLLQDFDGNKKTLKDVYFVLQFRNLEIEGSEDDRLVYCCSCNIARQKMVMAFPEKVTEETIKDLNEADPFRPCIHINTGKIIIEDFLEK